jgi:hypothetical protein
MSLSVNITNYRGVGSFRAELQDGITLIAGRNGQGKTSLLDAIARTLTGQTLPPGVNKKDADLLVHGFSGSGGIRVKNKGGSSAVEFPACKTSTNGAPPYATPMAVGLESLIEMSQKERSQFLYERFAEAPGDDDIREAIADANMAADEVDGLLDYINGNGWDAAYQKTRDGSKEAKAVWRHVTGETYGSSKGETWKPKGMGDDLTRFDVDYFDKRIERLRSERDDALKHQAVDEAELERLRESAARKAELIKARDSYDKKIAASEKRLAELEPKRPALLSNDDIPCPHCGEPITIQGRKLAKGGGATEKQIAAAQKKYDKHQEQIDDVKRALDNLRTERADVARDAEAAILATGRLESIKENRSSKTTREPGDLAKEIEELEYQRDMLTVYLDAAKQHRKIVRYEIIAAALAPDGLKLKALLKALGELNQGIAFLSGRAGWETTYIDPDLNVWYGGRPYNLVSASEQWRVRVILQLGVATDDAYYIIDGADILDRNGRNGLFAVLRYRSDDDEPPTCIVGMTLNSADDMPDMSRIGGASCWIEGGISGEQAAESEAA